MVYLKKIETKGFKSMGTPLVTVPVERGFIAITGPNGSGKSNLIDAILFALGENSAKTLRAPSLSALIYDASVEEQKPSSARVSLQFDNTDRLIPVNFDTVTISRELKSSGESVYWLNGKHVQRNNLSELLEMALINSRGLNIVLQGMITRVSELVPDEKRKLIEQLVGVAQFDEKKQLALTQLHDADSKLEIAMAKIGEIRERVQLLEEERNDQLRLKQLDGLINWLTAVTISSKLSTVQRIKETRRQKIAETGTRLEELQLHLANIKTEEENLESEKTELVRSAVDSGTAKLEAEIGKIDNELSALRKDRDEAANLINTYGQVLPALLQMSEGQSEKIRQSEAQVVSLHDKLQIAEEDKKRLLESFETLSAERSSLEKLIGIIQTRVVELRRKKECYDAGFLKVKERLADLSSQLRLAEDKLISDQGKVKFYTENLGFAEKSILDFESVLENQRRQLGRLQDSGESLTKLGKKVEGQLDIALSILEKAQTAVMRYDSDLSAIEKVATEEIALTRLESLGEADAIPGYFGPLRKLIAFQERYAQAIEALGREWLNAIVVQDVKSLTKTIGVAKRLKISRLTIIPLSEVGGLQKIRISPSGGDDIKSASEEIHCDRKFRGVVDFVFGDSVIVDSPKTAFLAARRGFRAATFRGDLFEAEILAFETGYHTSSYFAIADILDQRQGFEGVKLALDSLRGIIEKRKGDMTNLRAKTLTHEKEESIFGLDVSRTEAKLESSKQNLARYLEYANSFDFKINETESEIAQLRNKICAIEKQLKAYHMGSVGLSKLLASLDLGSFDSKNAELNSRKANLQSRIDSIVGEIRDLTTDLIRARGDLENSQRPNLERLRQQQTQTQESLETRKKFLADTEIRLQELETEISRLRQNETELLEKANRFKPLLEALDGKLKRLRNEAESKQKTLVSTQREFDSAKLDVERFEESESALRGQLAMCGYAEPIESFDGTDILLKGLQDEAATMRNNVNFRADENYREIFENYKYSSVRKNELEKERNAIVNFIEVIDTEKQKVFVEAFDRINKELGMIFVKMTDGSAWLELERPDSIFDGGIFLMTQFPGQLPRESGSVSGGQKTVAAISFILAIQAVFPSPFYVFDEVDAPLDSQYSGKMAEILTERSKFSQIIIVSLKDTVVSKASSVVGVYMSQGSSKIIRYKTPMEVELRNE